MRQGLESLHPQEQLLALVKSILFKWLSTAVQLEVSSFA